MSFHLLNELQSIFTERAQYPVLMYQGRTISYRELDTRVRRFAAALQRVGVEPGDRVALFTENKLPFLVAHLGTLFAGAVSLPLNPRYTAEEMRFFLADSGTRVAVVTAGTRCLVEDLRRELPALKSLVSDREAWEAPAGSLLEPAVGPDDAALLIYSSGTTGWPKGVVHTHGNMACALKALQKCWRVTSEDRVVNVLPLFHVHGLCFATHVPLLAGGCVVIDDHFEPRRTMELIGQGTIFMAVPTIYYRFLEQPEFRAAARNWKNIRLYTCGSAPIRFEVLPELEEILGRPIINRYGMSEAFVITSLPLDGPWPHGSVGLPLEGIEVQVVRDNYTPANPDNVATSGLACGTNEVGSVLIRGPNLFHGYWVCADAAPASGVASAPRGWFDTGDLGYRDNRGLLTLVGRKNDLIITNGYNVYPQVVERVVNACPGVRESAVLGLPDERRGERVVAAVVSGDPNLDAARLREFWEQRLVAYQRPVDVCFVESLPRNAMGKILRRELRDLILKSR
jgi:malonyl-CoA/methylmalonyl-CoA synthetase